MNQRYTKQKSIKGQKYEKARRGPEAPKVFPAFPYIAKDGTDGTQHHMCLQKIEVALSYS